MTVISLPALY